MNYCRGAVIFPHNIGLGAVNDADLMYEIGAATADQTIWPECSGTLRRASR